MAAQVVVGDQIAELRDGKWRSLTPGFAEFCAALDTKRGSDAFRALSVARWFQKVRTRMKGLDV